MKGGVCIAHGLQHYVSWLIKNANVLGISFYPCAAIYKPLGTDY